MANNLSDFIQLIKKNSIARTNRFRIQFTIPDHVLALRSLSGNRNEDIAKTMSLTCLITDIPAENMQASTVSYGNFERRVVFGRQYSDFTTSFLLTGKYAEKKIFDVWHKVIIDQAHHAIGYYDDYVTSIYVECLNEADQVMYSFEVKEAYPQNVGALKLDRTVQNGQMNLDVTWAFLGVETIQNNVTMSPPFGSNPVVPPVGIPGPLAGRQRMLAIPSIDQMSASIQTAAIAGSEFRSQLVGALNIAANVREQVRDSRMTPRHGVRIMNGVIIDIKSSPYASVDVLNEVVSLLTASRDQIGFLKDDTQNISQYPTR